MRAHAECVYSKREPGLPIPVRLSIDEQLALCQSALADPSLAGDWMPEEREFISTKPGRLKVMQLSAGVYAADSIDVLAHALGGLSTAPQPWARVYCVTRRHFAPRVFLGPRPASWLANPRLLPAAILRRIARVNEAYAWRSRVECLTLTIAFREGKEVETEAFVARLVAERAARFSRLGLFSPVRNDFPVGRMSFASHFGRNILFTEHEEQTVSQRLRAALWVLKPTSSWTEARAATPPGFVIPAHLRGAGMEKFFRRHFDPEVNTLSFRGMRSLPG